MGYDEPKLTAYALGELSGAERAEVAAYLYGNEAARRFVADMRETAHLLSDELARESFGGLSDLQYAAIEQKLSEGMRISKPRRHRGRRWERMVFAVSLAASVLILLGVVSILLPFVYQRIDRVAVRQPTPAPEKKSNFSYIPRSPASGTDPAPQPHAPVDLPHGDNLVREDEKNVPIDVPFVPAPDERLAAGNPERELSSPNDGMIGIHHSDNAKPARPVKITGPRTPVADANHGPAVPDQPTTPKRVDAYIPYDQNSPDKSHMPDNHSGSASAASHARENPFVNTSEEPISGFSAGVDTASYSNIRRFLTHGKLPPSDAVRIEEMLNYFPVRGSATAGDGPLELQVELGACPWRPERRLARVCVQARELPAVVRPPVNLVFVIDISKSMRSEKNKLPLLKQAMRLLVGRLSPHDRVSIVAYNYEAGVVLPPTPVEDKQAIWASFERIESGGSSNGGQGIEIAYDLANRAYLPNGVNRVILASDGGWNVGVTDRAALAETIARKSREHQVSLTVLGVGMDNLQDAMLQSLATAGNGSYAYIDTLEEAKKVLLDQMNGTLVAAARNVKVQVTFNPAVADSYRLIGYERRVLTKDELTSESKPGGELGAGQSVTALYEVIPLAKSTTRPSDMLTAKVTYADVITGAPRMLETKGEDHATPLPRTTTEFRFAAAVAEFGLMLRDSNYKGNATFSSVLEHTREATGPDETGYRKEFLNLVRKAKALKAQTP